MHFLSEFEKKASLINKALDQFMPPEDTFPGIIHQAMRYSVFAGGKRVRPVLTLAAAELIGGETKKIMPAACALELIHTYTLVHDDLPAMDNDDLRRGLPTCHKKYGEDIAILVGDALQSTAFELITRCWSEGGLPSDLVLTAINELSVSIGTLGVIGGQVVDTLSAADKVDKETLDYIHQKKTASLINIAVRLGAILSGGDSEDIKRLDLYSRHLGMAFQITDDILDVTGSEKNMGKPIGSDEKNNKATFPALYGIENSLVMAEKESEMALKCLEGYGQKADFLRETVKFILTRVS